MGRVLLSALFGLVLSVVASATPVKSMLSARGIVSSSGGETIKQVQYIQSTGTQYILFDMLVDGFDGYVLPEENNSFGAIGRWNGGSRADTIKFTSTQNRGWCVVNMGNSNPVYSMNMDNSSLIHAVVNGTSVSIAEQEFSMGKAWGADYTTGAGFALFGAYNTSDGSVSCRSSKIGPCKIYSNGSLAYDLVPVRIGSVGYFLDLNNQTSGPLNNGLFPNEGTGNFIIGPDL